MKRILAGLALALLIASPVSARANASIQGPDGAHFGETHGVTFEPAKAKVDPFRWWAKVECFANETTYGQSILDNGLVYAEYLHLGDQEGFPINDDEMTLGPTLSWVDGGADCTVTLLANDGNGGFRSYATDGFEVLP
jgi:hypothetical protein